MHRQRFPTPRLHKDIHRIIRVRVQRAEQKARLVSSDGDQTQFERSSQLSDLLEGGTDGEVGVGFSVVVFGRGELGDAAVAGVAGEVEVLVAGFYGPPGPEHGSVVAACAGAAVLGGETGYSGGDLLFVGGCEGEFGGFPPV